MEAAKVERILKRHGNRSSSLMAILQDIQALYNYLPRETLEIVAEKLGIPFSRVYSAGTFFKAFSLKPRGKHLVIVCLGTACHVRGGPRIAEEIERILGIKPGDTTNDRKFTLETVNCLGCCALGPLMSIDGKYFGNMTTSKVEGVLKQYKKEPDEDTSGKVKKRQ